MWEKEGTETRGEAERHGSSLPEKRPSPREVPVSGSALAHAPGSAQSITPPSSAATTYQFAEMHGGRFRTCFTLGRIYRSVGDWAGLMLHLGKGNERGRKRGHKADWSNSGLG